jgi:hypothetical protein
METYYEVTYTDKQGNNKRYTRDTVERGHYLYKSLVSDGMENVVLREVSANGIAQLRPYTPSKVKEQSKKEEPKSEGKPKTWFEAVWGIPEEEYNECVGNFARLHGTTKEEWGL